MAWTSHSLSSTGWMRYIAKLADVKLVFDKKNYVLYKGKVPVVAFQPHRSLGLFLG